MAGQLPPGIGNDQQALQATAFVREQPWYQQWIAARGKTPDRNGNVRLSDDERDELRDLIVSKGIGLNHKYDGIDENGQIVEEHHKLRNGLIGAAIGGAALTGFGAAGIGPLSGMFGAGASAAGAGAGAAIPATEGIASATALGLPVSAIEASPWLAAAAPAVGETAAASIPAEFGMNAVDTVASPAAKSGGFFSRAAGLLRPGGAGSKNSGTEGLLEKYGLPAVSGVFNNLAANRRNQDVLQQRESELDPYRGQMHQASDVARLDQMATGDFRATPTEITGRYAHSYEPNSPWLPSDTVRNVAAQGEMQVANGQGAELGDPLPRVRYAGQTPAALLAAAARKRRLVPDDENSPWLTGAA